MNMKWLSNIVVLMVLLISSIAGADLRSEEREFAEHGYKSMRALHEQTCSCAQDGNCKLKVTRAELKAQLQRFSESLPTMVAHLWPELTKKFSSMSTPDVRAYGERLGKDHLDSLPRDTVLLWARMLSSCWGMSAEPKTTPTAATPDKEVPHDGSLSKRGDVDDMKNGKLDEASGIAVFVQGCRGSAKDNPNAEPFCGCLSDYLRISPPSIIRVLQRDSETGDLSKIIELPGVKRCTKWVIDGVQGTNPFLKKGMKSSLAVEVAFSRCRTTLTNGKPTPSGIIFCNRFVATTP